MVFRADSVRWPQARRAGQVLGLAVAIPTALGLARARGPKPAVRYLVGLAAALAVQDAFVAAMLRRLGPEASSPADLLTMARATMGSTLAGLVAAGDGDRLGPAVSIASAGTLLAATTTDWLDGPVARRCGPTRLGAVLDIGADSWLTLWSAAGAVASGGLPRMCLLPPIVRCLQPLTALRRGRVPAGGGPWWSRASGTAQMALIVASLAPVTGRCRDRALALIAPPVSAAQLVAVVTLLWRTEMRPRPPARDTCR